MFRRNVSFDYYAFYLKISYKKVTYFLSVYNIVTLH